MKIWMSGTIEKRGEGSEDIYVANCKSKVKLDSDDTWLFNSWLLSSTCMVIDIQSAIYKLINDANWNLFLFPSSLIHKPGLGNWL